MCQTAVCRQAVRRRQIYMTTHKPLFSETTRRPVILDAADQEDGVLFMQSLLQDQERKYRLNRVLAEGGVGVLYEAEDLNCKRIVAMKVLQDERHKTREDWMEFVEEAQITARLEHPNIIPIYDVGLDGSDRLYYTMKLIRGKSLTDILIGLRHREPVMLQEYPLARLLNIFQKICDAVAFAHARGVIHCDLKPDNIMIADYGEVLVVDWGLARDLFDEKPAESSSVAPVADGASPMAGSLSPLSERDQKSGLKTLSGHIVGTPGFMAPERMDEKRPPPNTAADIYSLGAILYSILTLQPPLKVSSYKTPREMICAIRENNIKPPVDFKAASDSSGAAESAEAFFGGHCPDGRVPDAVSRIAMRALAKNPARRYASVPEMQQEVEAYQNGTCWQLVADHDMSNPASLEHWEVVSGYAQNVDGALRLCGGKPQILLFRQDVSGDVRIEYDCVIHGAYMNNLGCFISAVIAENKNVIPFSGYEFSYGAYENSIISLSRADHKVWSKTGAPLRSNVPFHVVAERSGNTLSLIVNEVCVFSVEDRDPLEGAGRSAIGLYSWLTDVRYSRVRVYVRGVPWHADILDIAERQLQKGRYEVARAIYSDVLESRPEEKRMVRAQEGLEKARRREQQDRKVQEWQRLLNEAWPHASPKISVVNDELYVEVTHADITDLSPLIGLPLAALYCQHNRIHSLEPLRGMKLELLNCMDNPVDSLEPLRDMPLKALYAENCKISDLTPLTGMPLNVLNVGGCGEIETLEPLAGLPLVFLSCWGNRIRSLKPLQGLSLTSLFCGGNEMTEVEALRGSPLNVLQISGNPISDLGPLENAPLTWLSCACCNIESLEPLRKMGLTFLSCHGNRIRDLLPLQGMPIQTLTCGDNLLETIEPFTETPPWDFTFGCETMSPATLKDLRSRWSARPEMACQVNRLDTMIALREESTQDLRQLAQSFGHYRYLYIPRFMTWSDAVQCCRQLGGTLLTIGAAEENEFVTNMIPFGRWVWLGLERVGADGFRWINGDPMNYENFADTLQRNKNGYKVFNGTWCNEDIAGIKNCFVIKWPVDPS